MWRYRKFSTLLQKYGPTAGIIGHTRKNHPLPIGDAPVLRNA